MTADVKITPRTDGLYDINLTASGDLESVDGLDTSIIVSLMTDARADASEVNDPYRRRGWWGVEADPEIERIFGSKLWLQDQARLTNMTLAKLKDAAQKSLQWLVDDGYFKSITIRPVAVLDGVRIYVTLTADNNRTETVQYTLVNATGA